MDEKSTELADSLREHRAALLAAARAKGAEALAKHRRDRVKAIARERLAMKGIARAPKKRLAGGDFWQDAELMH